jgi:hypothetical protein
MKLNIIAPKQDFKSYAIKKSYEFGEPIPIPPYRVILITVPEGVFRCNLNDGILADDRKFIQNEGSKLAHILRFKNLESYQDPTLTVKIHSTNENANVTIEFA